MKKLFALVLAMALSFTALTGCGRNNNDKNNNTTPPSATTPDKENPNMPPENNPDKKDETLGEKVEDVVLSAGATLEDIVVKLGEEMGIAMPQKLDDETLKDVFNIDPADIEEYYGEYSVVNTSSDHIIAVKVKEGRMDDVKKAFEERRDSVVKDFEQYLPDQLEKAKNASIIEKGPYLFFVIAGDAEKGIDKEVTRIKEIIEGYF